MLPAKSRAGHALRFAAHREPLETHAVQPDVDLVRLAHADDVVVLLAPEQNLDGVLGIQREVVANQRAALRSERQVVAHLIVLHQRLWRS